ncbi:helix-turn-helix domain-containing protein [Segnochrobactraceae bacterium EtOH-i3]
MTVKTIPLKRLAYNVGDAASALGVTDAAIKRALKAGTLKGRKIGARWLVSAESLETFVREGARHG